MAHPKKPIQIIRQKVDKLNSTKNFFGAILVS